MLFISFGLLSPHTIQASGFSDRHLRPLASGQFWRHYLTAVGTRLIEPSGLTDAAALLVGGVLSPSRIIEGRWFEAVVTTGLGLVGGIALAHDVTIPAVDDVVPHRGVPLPEFLVRMRHKQLTRAWVRAERRLEGLKEAEESDRRRYDSLLRDADSQRSQEQREGIDDLRALGFRDFDNAIPQAERLIAARLAGAEAIEARYPELGGPRFLARYTNPSEAVQLAEAVANAPRAFSEEDLGKVVSRVSRALQAYIDAPTIDSCVDADQMRELISVAAFSHSRLEKLGRGWKDPIYDALEIVSHRDPQAGGLPKQLAEFRDLVQRTVAEMGATQRDSVERLQNYLGQVEARYAREQEQLRTEQLERLMMELNAIQESIQDRELFEMMFDEPLHLRMKAIRSHISEQHAGLRNDQRQLGRSLDLQHQLESGFEAARDYYQALRKAAGLVDDSSFDLDPLDPPPS